MSRVIAVLACFAIVSSAAAQELGSRAPPATKMEAFSARTGVVLIKGYTELGKIKRQGTVSMNVREFRDGSTPKIGQYGVAIEVKEDGRLERESRSFIDEDEIDSLIKGIEYVAKVSRDVTTLQNFEAQYKTKGDFSVTVYSRSGDGIGLASSGGTGLAVSSGSVGRTTAYLETDDAELLTLLLGDAKRLIAAAKAAPR